MGPSRKVFLLEREECGKYMPEGSCDDAREMQRIYLEELGRGVSIAYGANVETSANPDVVREYGL